MRINILWIILCMGLASWGQAAAQTNRALADSIRADSSLANVSRMAADLIRTGFNAGSGYGEVWIRDFNTFIDLSCAVMPRDSVRRRLKIFFEMQGADGNIIDGYIPRSKASVGYDYIYSELAPGWAGHKNTVETDQETSLIQAVYRYVHQTGDTGFLREEVGGRTIAQRMEDALSYLMKHRFASRYGLLYGATTVDWGDVQPETPWGVVMDSASHPAIDIYDNAMMVIALNDFIRLFPANRHWPQVRAKLVRNIRRYLWDARHQKFRPHLYLKGSPFPASFDENKIHYHGGTATAIAAGLLRPQEVRAVNAHMLANVRAAGAMSIGLTVYPPYPQGYFKNKGLYPYGYQNGGDWTWFGARMITQLVRYGLVREAYREIRPMIDRVLLHQGFYEWYTPDGQPSGSGSFRGSAGVLYTAISALQQWAGEQEIPAN